MFLFVVQVGGAAFRFQRYAAEHPENVTVTRAGNSTTIALNQPVPGLGPDVDLILMMGMALVLSCFVLLAAAVTRRLHDIGKPGWFGLPTAVLLTSGMALMGVLFSLDPDQSSGLLFLAAFLNNGLYLASLAGLLFLLARRSDSEPNRFGPVPPDAGGMHPPSHAAPSQPASA